MKKIPLTRGYVALVDDEDYELVSQYKWHAGLNGGGKGFHARGFINGKNTSMHRFLMQAPSELEVDHRDHDRLNNTRANLRLCTRTQNAANSRPKILGARRRRFKGVSRMAPNRWRAVIHSQGNIHRLGLFRTAKEAALAYDHEAGKLWGDFAYLNFPDYQGDPPRPLKRKRTGSLNGYAKLTEKQVRTIRKLHATGKYKREELAERFNVSGATISNITNRDTWTHI